VFILGGAALKRTIELRETCAIVIAQKSEVKFEPMDSATTYFTLGEAARLK